MTRISCFVDVPGEQCEYKDGRYECKEITNPRLEENKRIILKLRGEESLKVKGELSGKSVVPLYSVGGQKKQILNLVLSSCEIIEAKTK